MLALVVFLFGKVDVPNPMFDLKRLPIFKCYMVGCESKNMHQKHVLKSDSTTSLSFVTYSRRNKIGGRGPI